jgi:hypothetical protein
MILNQLLQTESKIAVLAGAGISIDSPSNLLDGWTFMFETLRRAAPHDLDRMLKRSSTKLMKNDLWERSWVLSILKTPNVKYYRPGEMLRFESLMYDLAESGLDSQLSVLNCFDKCDRPNRNHFILAHLIRAGHVVITTNFDRLIEIAYAHINGKDDPPLRVVYMDEDFPDRGPSYNDPPTIWKIHGSLSVNGMNTRNSIQAKILTMLTTTMTTHKRAFLTKLLASFDLFVVGYSGWDDFDIIPILSNTPSKKRLIWIDHKGVPELLVSDANQLKKEDTRNWEIDTVARDRIRFNVDLYGNIIRSPENILFISTPTTKMMDAFCEVYLDSNVSEPRSDNFKFGSRYPDETQKYFDDWRATLSHERSAPYIFISRIFFERANARKDFKRRIKRVERKVSRLQGISTATPGEKLHFLITRFNISNHKNHKVIEKLRRKLLKLFPSVSSELQGVATRLLACMIWELEGPVAGTAIFKKAVNIDRRIGNIVEEFNTLTTWRGHAGYSQWSDLLFDEPSNKLSNMADAAYYREVSVLQLTKKYPGVPLFPEEETRRIYELAAKTGFFPRLWSQALGTLTNYIDDDFRVVNALYYKIQRMQRYFVDVGDVLGEAQATLKLGRLLLINDEFENAMVEFLRVLELNRIISQPNLVSEAKWYLRHCERRIGSGNVDTFSTLLQQSMWKNSN